MSMNTTTLQTGHEAEMEALKDYDSNWTYDSPTYYTSEQTLAEWRILFGIKR